MATERTKRITDYLPYIPKPLNLRLSNTGVEASGILLKTGRVKILAGSMVRNDATPSIRRGVADLRENLVHQGIIKNWRFEFHWEASNPSQASNIILGSRTTGFVQWWEVSSGKPLGEYLEQLKRSSATWIEGHWTPGYWREDLQSIATPKVLQELDFLKAYAELQSVDDPRVGIAVSLFRKV